MSQLQGEQNKTNKQALFNRLTSVPLETENLKAVKWELNLPGEAET